MFSGVEMFSDDVKETIKLAMDYWVDSTLSDFSKSNIERLFRSAARAACHTREYEDNGGIIYGTCATFVEDNIDIGELREQVRNNLTDLVNSYVDNMLDDTELYYYLVENLYNMITDELGLVEQER